MVLERTYHSLHVHSAWKWVDKLQTRFSALEVAVGPLPCQSACMLRREPRMAAAFLTSSQINVFRYARADAYYGRPME